MLNGSSSRVWLRRIKWDNSKFDPLPHKIQTHAPIIFSMIIPRIRQTYTSKFVKIGRTNV